MLLVNSNITYNSQNGSETILMTESDEQIELCGKCGQAKSGSGRLTQWIKVCSCYSVPELETDNETELKLCSTCGKRIASGRAGSFTQWVFRSDACSCPKPEHASHSDTMPGSFIQSIDDSEADSATDEFERQQLAEIYADRIPAERYLVLKEIGKGAAGTVVLCRDLLLKKKVAIKSLNFLERQSLLSFQQEAKATSRLNHSNIVQVMDFGTTASGAPYMVMEYFEGVSLESYLDKDGPMPATLALDVFKQVLDALIYSHSNKVWHRDIKPSNILLADQGNNAIAVRLIDFGIAAFTQTNFDVESEQLPVDQQQHKTLAGTPAYMSPDQALGRPYDARSEIYSLGCVLFEMLTGRPPFIGHTALETISLHGQAIPPKLTDTMGDTKPSEQVLLGSIELVIETCLAKDPKDRYQSVQQLKQALNRCNSELPERQESLIKGLDLQLPEDITRGDSSSAKKDNTVLVLLAIVTIITIPLILFVPVLLKEEASTPKISSVLYEGTDEGQAGDLILQVGQHTWHAFVDANTKRVLRNVKRRTQIKNLWLSTIVDDALIDYISTMNLDGLAFDDTTFEDMDKSIGKITKMDTLNLLVFLQSNLTDHSLEQISTMPKLHFLAVQSDLITDRGIAKLKAIPNLYGISFSGMKQVTDKTVDTILSMPKLIAISVGDTQLTASGAVRLIQSGKYVGMSLGGIPLTTPLLNSLRDSKIQKLSLMHSEIDERTLDTLSVMKQLKTCDLRNSPTVNQASVDRMIAMRKEAGLPPFLVLFGTDNTARDWDVMIDK